MSGASASSLTLSTMSLEGFYALFNFSAVPEFPEEFYRVAGITDGVLRSLIVRK